MYSGHLRILYNDFMYKENLNVDKNNSQVSANNNILLA